MTRTRILGLSSHYHDSAAALVVDGRIVAAAHEERFSRIKGDAAFPHQAIGACLEAGGIAAADLDHVAYYENPVSRFDRLLVSHHAVAPRGLRGFLKAMPPWLTEKLWLAASIPRELGSKAPLHLCDHHLAHAASAFYPSPFERAAILTIDGVGEWSTATIGRGDEDGVALLEELRFPDSLGLLYSAFTHYCGFRINSGEYKLMGLAPYGVPRHADLIRREIVRLEPDGALALNQRCFDYLGGLVMTSAHCHALLGGPPRAPEAPLAQRDADVAASIQLVLDDAVLAMARHAHAVTGLPDLVMAGGVALNVVSVGRLRRDGPFRATWVQPAAGDAGGSIGAALWAWHDVLGRPRDVPRGDGMSGAMLGLDIPPASDEDDATLRRLGGTWETLTEEAIAQRTAESLRDGLVVAVARGRAEMGPRALGARSILADARDPDMQSRLNLKIKFREGFRPFAPAVLADRAGDWFEIEGESPYMLSTYAVRGERLREGPSERRFLDRIRDVRSTIPAVTHVDGTARVQTVDAARFPFLHDVLARFDRLTGCPVLVNTSFNVRGEPIVNTAEDAYRCFMATGIDRLVVGNRFLVRDRQARLPLDDAQRGEWLRRFAHD